MTKNNSGRPTKYKEEYNDLVFNYCLLGATDEEISEFLEIQTSTLYEWKKKYPKFSEAIRDGKEKADAQVARSLYLRAIEGDTSSMIFWLKNRQSQKWRDKQDFNHESSDGSMTPQIYLPDNGRDTRED